MHHGGPPPAFFEPHIDISMLAASTLWLLAAVVLAVCAYQRRWRLGIAVYVLIGGAIEAWLQLAARVSPLGQDHRSYVVGVVMEGVSYRFEAWLQLGVVAAMLGGLAGLAWRTLRRRARVRRART
jgi:hypothetical protein